MLSFEEVTGTITVTVKGMATFKKQIVKCHMKRHYTLAFLMEQYCLLSDLPQHNMYFFYKGERVFETDTPESIGMRISDTIDAFLFHF